MILNTEDPAEPTIISEFDDEAINVWHQADPVTIGGRELLIVEDELAGAAAPGVCPTGGVHVFDISDETLPVKVGYWNISDPAVRNPDDTCTAHVFDIHEDAQIMTIAYYMGGVRVVDLSGLADAPIGVGQGDQALGGAMRADRPLRHGQRERLVGEDPVHRAGRRLLPVRRRHQPRPRRLPLRRAERRRRRTPARSPAPPRRPRRRSAG